MKSRTLSCKTAFFKKNMVRFMPFWVIYTLCLLLGMTMLMDRDLEFYFALNLGACARFMALINCGYALLVAQLLFGDLYDSRMCSGIHALPLRREEIFLVNILSGLLFSLIPTGVMTLCSLPLMAKTVVEGGMAIPFLWFAASNLEFLLFFGLAVFSAFCAGNRLGMAVVYGILNFGSMLLNLMIASLYVPLLNGVSYSYERMTVLTPVVKIASEPLMIVGRVRHDLPGTMTLQPSWGYVIGCAVIGAALLLVALQMYRRRALETAGEFMAVKSLRPVFLVLFSLLAATCLSLVVRLFFGAGEKSGLSVAFGLAGLTAGWFVGLMLLKKTLRVFGKKAFLGFGILTAVIASSLLLTHLDIFGIAAWVPEKSEIQYVQVVPEYTPYQDYWGGQEQYNLRKPEDLEMVTKLHRLAIQENLGEEDKYFFYYDHYGNTPSQFGRETGGRYTVPVSFLYHMKDGSVRARCYYVYVDGEAGELLKMLYSRDIYAVDRPLDLALELPADYVGIGPISLDEQYRTRKEITSLEQAIRKDCAEGNMSRFDEFHSAPIWENGIDFVHTLPINVSFNTSAKYSSPGFYVHIYSDSANTIKWLEERGLLQQIIQAYEDMNS